MKVSFILPAYKRRFLKEAIDSILKQTYHDFELVVVDDCSPENLKEVIDEFQDDRLTYHRNVENVGGKDLVAAWNRAMEYAKGEWCVLASDDDVYAPEYLERILGLAERYPEVDLFHCRVAQIDERNKSFTLSAERAEFETQEQMVIARGIKRIIQTAQEFMFRISALKRIGGFVNFPAAWYSDDATWMELSEHGVACVPEVLFSWRCSGLNISSRYDDLEVKQLASEQYKRWLSAFLSRMEERGSFVSSERRKMCSQIYGKVDELCRYQMNRVPAVRWLAAFNASSSSLKLRLLYVMDFVRRVWRRLVNSWRNMSLALERMSSRGQKQ